MNKKISFLIGILFFLLTSFLSYSFFSGGSEEFIKNPLSKYKAPAGSSIEVADNEPKTEECPMNGELMTKKQKAAWEKRRPLGIMIENHLESRPQSGFSSADIIYEAVAEGGITRFLSIFYCKDADPVGPVRSARVYFLNMLQEYGDYPLYAHVGGANCDEETGSGCANGAKADALGIITKMGWAGYNDMNQFSVPFPNFWRDYERIPNAATEHTVYSSTKKLWDYAKNKRQLSNVDQEGIAWDKTFTPWKFQDEAKPEQRGDLQKISFGFWSSFADQYNINWIYDKTSNSFKRENGGQPHMDKNNNKQLEAKNVIVVYMAESPANDGYPGGHILYQTTGSGKALIFQNGKAVDASWQKTDAKSRIKFEDSSGQEISMVRGKIFIEILPIGNKVVY